MRVLIETGWDRFSKQIDTLIRLHPGRSNWVYRFRWYRHYVVSLHKWYCVLIELFGALHIRHASSAYCLSNVVGSAL